MIDIACNAVRYFRATILLYLTYTVYTAMTFLPFFLLDSFFRIFVSDIQSHSHRRHFIEPRPIDCAARLRAVFHSSIKPCLDSSQPTSTCCVGSRYYTLSPPTQYQVSVSGRYSIIPLFGISVRETLFPRCFYLFAGLLPLKVYLQQHIASQSQNTN